MCQGLAKDTQDRIGMHTFASPVYNGEGDAGDVSLPITEIVSLFLLLYRRHRRFVPFTVPLMDTFDLLAPCLPYEDDR